MGVNAWYPGNPLARGGADGNIQQNERGDSGYIRVAVAVALVLQGNQDEALTSQVGLAGLLPDRVLVMCLQWTGRSGHTQKYNSGFDEAEGGIFMNSLFLLNQNTTRLNAQGGGGCS